MKHDKLMTAMTSSEHQDWATPPNLVKYIEDYFFVKFDLDAAASSSNHKAPIYFTIEDNSLLQNWFGNVWLNPPYGKNQSVWIEKCILENQKLNTDKIFVLIPARTDTKVFHELIVPNAQHVYFIKSRINFSRGQENEGTALFPSMLVMFNNSNGINFPCQFWTLNIPIESRRF